MRRHVITALAVALHVGLPPPSATSDDVCVVVGTSGSDIPNQTVRHCHPTPFPAHCRYVATGIEPRAVVWVEVCGPRAAEEP